MLAGDCIKYFAGLGDDGLPHDLKGAIELNKNTQVAVKEARLLIVSHRVGDGGPRDERALRTPCLCAVPPARLTR